MTRNILPNRRCHLPFDFEFWGVDFTAGRGKVAGPGGVPVGPVLEVFLNAGKEGTAIDVMSRDAAVVLSIALQFGAPIETLRHAITRNENGTPQGPVGQMLDLLAAIEGTK
jgi:hypothetical protein